MSSTSYLRPSLNFYKHACFRFLAAFPYSAEYWTISALLVSEKLVYRFHFLALFGLVCFSNTRFMPLFTLWVAINRSDPSVLVAWKSHSRTEILASTHLENKNSFWRTMELILPPSLLCSYYTKPETSITAVHFFSWNNQVTFIGLTSTCLLTTPTKSHSHKFLIIENFSLWWHQHSQNSQK